MSSAVSTIPCTNKTTCSKCNFDPDIVNVTLVANVSELFGIQDAKGRVSKQ